MALSKHVHAGRISYLDGWRGIALLAVLLGHFLPLREDNYPLAVLGVEFFFVLSGRLMADILFVETFPLPEFFRRRFSRIFPGLAAFVLLIWLATFWSGYGFKPLAALFALTFTLNYAMVIGHGVAAIENLWSLCVEEHAYAFLGLVAFLARRRIVSPTMAIAIAGAASLLDGALCTAVLHQDYRTVYWRTDAHVASILLGALAYLVLRRRSVPSWAPVLAILVTVAIWPLGNLVRYTLGTALLAASVATIDQAPPLVTRALSFEPLTYVGLTSYSLYLWQQPFFRLMWDGKVPAWLGAALAVACGLASYYAVEQPARRLLNKGWRPPRPHAVASGADLAN